MSFIATNVGKKPLNESLDNPSSNSPPAAPESASLPMLQDDLSKDLVRFFKLLSDETRLRILFCLTQTPELHVRALCDLLGQSQPAVSHHLGMLRNAGIVESRRDGKRNYYRIAASHYQHLLQLLFQNIPQRESSSPSTLPADFGRPGQPR